MKGSYTTLQSFKKNDIEAAVVIFSIADIYKKVYSCINSFPLGKQSSSILDLSYGESTLIQKSSFKAPSTKINSKA